MLLLHPITNINWVIFLQIFSVWMADWRVHIWHHGLQPLQYHQQPLVRTWSVHATRNRHYSKVNFWEDSWWVGNTWFVRKHNVVPGCYLPGDSNISPALLKVWTLPYERHRYSHIILITNTNQDCSPPLSSRGLPHSHYHYTQDESWSRLAQLLVRGHICDPFYPIIYHSLKPKNIKRFTGHGWTDAQVLSLLMGFYKICDTNPWKIST